MGYYRADGGWQREPGDIYDQQGNFVRNDSTPTTPTPGLASSGPVKSTTEPLPRSQPISDTPLAPSSGLSPVAAGAGQVGPVPNPGVLMGFDQSRFSDPAAMQTSKYYIGQLLSAGMSGADAVDAAKAAGFNVSWDPTNQNIGLDDTRDGYIGLRPANRSDPNSGNVWQWMTYNNSVQPPGGFQPGDINSDAAATPPPGGNTIAPGVSAAPIAAAAPSTLASPATTDYNAQMRQTLLALLKDASGPVSANDPTLKPALDAYNVQSARDQQAQRDQLAERFYAMGSGGGAGLDSGAFDTALRQNAETAAQGRANFAGQTVYNAAQAKRTQLQNLLATAVQYGLTDQAQQIQQQIALIDASLQKQGLDQQLTIANNGLGYSYAALIAQMNRDAVLQALNG